MNCHYLCTLTTGVSKLIGKEGQQKCSVLNCFLSLQHNGIKRGNYAVLGWTGAMCTEATKAAELTTSHLRKRYESHRVMDVSKSLHFVFDQGALKDTNLVIVSSYQLISIVRHNQGSILLFFFKSSPKRFGQGQMNILICSLSTNNPSVLPILPIRSSFSWWSVTSHPCWSRASLRGCLGTGTAGWLTCSDHGGFKSGWPFNRLAASGKQTERWLTGTVVPLRQPYCPVHKLTIAKPRVRDDSVLSKMFLCCTTIMFKRSNTPNYEIIAV